MKPGVVANFMSELKPFQKATIKSLDEQPTGAFSGVSKDGSYCWVVSGAQLEVLETSSQNRLGSWQFGEVMGSQDLNITCVEELRFGHTRKLLVGLSNAALIGQICLFNVSQSRVVKAIQIPYPVTELEVVCTETRKNMPRWALSEQLRYFCGLVAVGTTNGYVYLVDLAMNDSEYYSDEEEPSRLHNVSPRNRDIEHQKHECDTQGIHLCMTLNESMYTRNGFEYQKPDGIVMKTFQPERISVTCLKYVPQIGILVVGYDFGCFQLWKLGIPVLEYSSRLELDQMPVTHVAYQEPENDPKNFSYLWVARGHAVTDEELEAVSSIAMYQLSFNHKSFYSNYGVFYDELTSICQRLTHDLTHGASPDQVSRVIACYTLADPHYKPPIYLGHEESFEEGCHSADLSLCVFVWEVMAHGGSAPSSQHLAVFDINRWYHAQMPSYVRFVSGSTDRCSYFSFCRLDEATDKAESDQLLMAHVPADRIRRFVSTSVIPPDQHFYPSSLAFSLRLVFDVGIVEAQFLGAQRQVLANLERLGPRALIQPQDLHSQCIYVGLLPPPHDSTNAASTVVQQREALLSLALDYNMVSFLNSCIIQWSSGESDQVGCSLRFLLDWLWDKVSTTKHQIDTTTVNLYNWSGLSLDQRSLQTLLHCDHRLKHLISILQVLIQTGQTTEQGQTDLQSKLMVTSLLSQHLNVVLWFLGARLLPETDDTTEAVDGTHFCYPVNGLTNAYKKRRTDLQQIDSELRTEQLLMIDGLVDCLGVSDLWEREGGTGQYPPPSLHALLSTYLMEKVEGMSKHCLVLYLLLDLVSLDADDQHDLSDKVLKFAVRFGVSRSLVKYIQAFWLLDHQDFEEALVHLLDPMVNAEFTRWQHKRIIKALLYQGAAKMALRYIQSVKPALTTSEEVKLKLTVLLANGMTSDALQYQRVCRDLNSSKDLLTHLFLGCQQTKTIDRLLQLPLTLEEETLLVNYLVESQEPHSQELLVMYYLQRARYIEAIQLNEKLKHTILVDANPKARERAAARNAIVDSFAKLLPNIQRKLMFEQNLVTKKAPVPHSVCARPTPLSTKITQNKSNIMSRSSYILAIIEKLDEIDTEEDQAETKTMPLGPFIRTPVTPARNSLRNTPATAFPEPVEETQAVLGRSVFAFQDADTPTSIDKRKSRFFSASCLSLLQTPKIQPVKPRTPTKSSAKVMTPQSILKIRSITTKMSPSPLSSNTTPNSQEVESSARKLPRKLGYGSASQTNTPHGEQILSSVPRHLATEMPSLPSSPRPPSTSQPTTPKSVSFADTTFSRAAKMKTLTTPRRDQTPVKPVDDDTTSPMTRSMSKSPDMESPITQSEEPMVSDEIHRRPLRRTPPKTMEKDDRISDEEVEEMDTEEPAPSLQLQISTSSKNSSNLSVQTTPPVSPQKSPTKPTSPTVKISKSPVSAFSVKTGEELAQEAEADTTQPESAKGEKDRPLSVAIDLTEEDEMEVDSAGEKHEIFTEDEEITPLDDLVEEEGVDVKSVLQADTSLTTQEVNTSYQSVKQEVEEMNMPNVPVFTPPSTSYAEDRQPSTSKYLRRSITPQRNSSNVGTPESSPGSRRSSRGSYSSKSSVSPQSLKKDDILKLIDEKFADSPELQQAQVGSSSESVTQTKTRTTRTRKTFEIRPIKYESRESEERTIDTKGTIAGLDLRDSETQISDSVETKVSDVLQKVEAENVSDKVTQPTTPTRSRRSVKPLSVSHLEEPVTPTRSTRSQRKSTLSEQTVTPTRSSARSKVKQEQQQLQELVTITAGSPKPVSQTAREIVQESLIQISTEMKERMETDTTEMTKIKDRDTEGQKSPSRSSRNSRKSFTPNHDVEQLDENVSQSPSRKSKNKNNSSPTRRSNDLSEIQNRTPTRSRHKKDSVSDAKDIESDSFAQTLLPLETLDSLKENEGSTSGRQSFETSEIPLDFIEDSVETTPSRRRSLPRHCKSDLDQLPRTPTRRQSLASSAKLCKEENQNSDSSADIPRTPTRRGRAKKIETSELENIVENESLVLTPSRRGQRKTNDADTITDTTEVVEEATTPSRRGRGKKSDISVDSDQEKVPLTPSRKGRSKKNIDTDAEQEKEPLTPSRRGRAKKVYTDQDNKPDIAEQPATPSRKGRSKKKDIELDQKENEIENNTQPVTPSRRGRPKKTDKDTENVPVTPTRKGRGRGKKVDTEEEDIKTDVSEAQIKPGTPSRRGRGKKAETQVEEAKDMDVTEDIPATKPATPSRRGRGRKADTEKDQENETVQLTPSRSKRAKKEKVSPVRKAAEEQSTVLKTVSPRVSNLELYDIQSASFQFSGPMMVDEPQESTTPAKPFTPSKSFLFSPPITTHVKSKSGEATEEEKGILLPPGETAASIQEETKKAKKPAKKGKSRKLYSESEKVLLISPVQGKDDSGSEGLEVVTRTTRAGTRKATAHKDGTQLLLQSMNLGQKKPRTSHRFGPVGKKKT